MKLRKAWPFFLIVLVALGAALVVFRRTDNGSWLSLPTSNGSLRTLKTSFVYDVAFVSNTTLATAHGSELDFWDVNVGKRLKRLPMPRPTRASNFSPDGQLFLGGRQMRDTHSKALVSTLQGNAEDWVMAPVFSPDNALVACPVEMSVEKPPGRNRAFPHRDYICAWNARTGKRLWSAPFSDDSGVAFKHPVAFSPDSRYLVEATAQMFPTQADIRLLDARTGKLVRVLVSDPDVRKYALFNSVGWYLIAFSPDSKLVAAVGGETSTYADNGHDGAVYVWEVATGKLLWKGLKRGAQPLVMRFSPDGSVLACGCYVFASKYSAGDGVVTLWDVKSGGLLRTYNGDTNADRRTFAWSAFKQTLQDRRSPPRSGGATRYLPGDNSSPVRALAFTPDGKRLAAGDEMGTVRIWPVPAVENDH